MADVEKIRIQAKRIMDDFMIALDKVKGIEERFGIDRAEETRVPSKKPKPSAEFRAIMFSNAPKVKDDCIVAEKKKW